MKKTLLYLGLAIVIAACIAVWLKTKPAPKPEAVPPLASNAVGNAILQTNQGQASAKKHKPWVRPPGVDDAGWKYLSMMRELMFKINQPVEFYARVVDQNGEPVSGAQLEMNLTRVDEELVLEKFPHMNMGEEQVFQTNVLYSDAKGWMQLNGITGHILTVRGLAKEGYLARDFNGGVEYKIATVVDNGTTQTIGDLDADVLDPAKGYTFHLWKKGATEKLIKVDCAVGVEPFGTNWYAVNFLTGQTQNPDLLFWFETTNDANGNASRQFRFRAVNGGMQVDAEPYPYQAPAAGYESAWDWYYEPFGRNANQDLSGLLKKQLYFKLRNGKIYGAITWHWGSENGVGISGYINPTGSRNLEPDPEKLITDPAEIRHLDEATRVK